MSSTKNRYKYTNQYKKNLTNPTDNPKNEEEEKLINTGDLLEDLVENIQEPVSKEQTTENIDISKVETLKIELEDWKNRAIRLTADIQNLQTQAKHDESIIRKNTKKNLINSLIPFLNTLNLAFSYAPSSDDPKIQKFINALQGSFNSLSPELNKHGVEIILPKTGDDFDPISMNALNQSQDLNLVVKQLVGIGIRVDGQLTTPATVMI